MKQMLLMLLCASCLAGCAMTGSPSRIPVCHLHKLELREDVVPISHGPLKFPPYYTQARDTIFPLANRVAFATEHLTTNSPQEKAVRYCPECRNAKDVFDDSILWIEHEFREAAIRHSNKTKEGAED